jgi:3-phosphoshikimate 1-carboxyvinyltransferase
VSEMEDVRNYIVVYPGDLKGDITMPFSKSILHRALFCAALSGDLSIPILGEDTLSDDIQATVRCLEALIDHSSLSDEEMAREPIRLFCKESGTTLRFLVPFVAALGIPASLDGSGRLPDRPLSEYAQIFSGKGVRLEFPSIGRYLPLSIKGKLKPGRFSVPGDISSQYISGLLMVLPILDGDSEIILSSPLESEPYVEMTREVMLEFGVVTERTKTGYLIEGNQKYHRDLPYLSEPDYSQAAFWLVAEYLGHKVSVMDLPDNSLQGDCEIRELLLKLRSMNGSSQFGEMPMLGVDASQIPDLVPIFAVAAAATPCVTRITNAERLRLKESDRLVSTKEILTRMGASISETSDGLIIFGKARVPGQPIFKSCDVDSYNDHRMVMVAAIAATRANGPVQISNFRAIDKSYPDFFRDFRMMGGKAIELNLGG